MAVPDFVLCEELSEIGRFWTGYQDDEGHWIPGFAGDGETVQALIEHRQSCKVCRANYEYIEARRRRLAEAEAEAEEIDESARRPAVDARLDRFAHNNKVTGAIRLNF